MKAPGDMGCGREGQQARAAQRRLWRAAHAGSMAREGGGRRGCSRSHRVLWREPADQDEMTDPALRTGGRLR
jgi:hypothetical protein